MIPVNSTTTLSAAELKTTSEEAARNAIALEPKLPSANLAESILLQADPEVLSQIQRILLLKHFTGVVRSERKKMSQSERKDHALFPEWNTLPDYIALPNGHRVELAKASTKAANALVAKLKRKYRATLAKLRGKVKSATLEKPLELVQAEAFAAKMAKAARRHRGITAAEVAARS